MSFNKISSFLEKHNIHNIIKVLLILIALFLLYRIFTSNSNDIQTPTIEGFASIGGQIYGNTLSLSNTQNIPVYETNKCIFELNGGVSRIDTLQFVFDNNNDKVLNLQFVDGNGNMKYIKNPNSTDSTNKFKATSSLTVSNVTDDNGLSVFTSKIIMISDNDNMVDYMTNNNKPYVKEFGIFGSDRKMPVKTDYDNMSNVFMNSPLSAATDYYKADTDANTDSYTFIYTGTSSDPNMMIYALSLDVIQADSDRVIALPSTTEPSTTQPSTTMPSTTQPSTTIPSTTIPSTTIPSTTIPSTTIPSTTIPSTTVPSTTIPSTTVPSTTIPSTTVPSTTVPTASTEGFTNIPASNTQTPFTINIEYYNTLYKDSKFTVSKQYLVRSDNNRLGSIYNDSQEYIYLDEPIIANKIVITTTRVNVIGGLKYKKITVMNITANGKKPSATEIESYKRNVNLVKSDSFSDNTNICPSINEVADQQNKAQKICDNLEYQDKVKGEKLRLERNKQYLVQLKQQQEQIDTLNSVIQDLENKRQGRSEINDQIRVLEYQKQKELSSRIRDLANERLASQDRNSLYLDVKFTQ